ncbi:MAG: SurA N-terminal domain-containing protein [Proteobacteria bacterium]|nr:SurA N-terminal domain-containing protein [Pseudomonadota bacterium]
MLTWIRDKSTGLFMTIVMGILILAFALWGVGDYFSQSSSDSLATVNGETITYSDYSNQFATYRQNMLNQFGDQLEPDFFDSPMMRRNFLESMINSELHRQAAFENGYTVTGDQIRSILSDVEIFQNADGQFDRELYAGYLAQTNQSAQALQARIVNEEAGQAVNQLFDETAFMTPKEAKTIAILRNQTRDFDYFLIQANQFAEDVTVSDDEISDYYNSNSNQFMTQEMVKVDYIELDAEQVANQIEVTEQDALSYYEENKQRFEKSAQRKASHILINDDNQAQETLNTIQTQLDQGTSFADLAKEYSQDPGSAEQGGDLGLVNPGDMVEEFDEALFSMEEGQISEPVKTQFGFHIIKLEEIKAARVPSFEEVRTDIVQELQASQAQTLFLDRANELSGLVLDAQSGLSQAAEETNLTVETTDFFPRSGGEGLAANPEFVKMAYSSMVKNDLLNSDVVNLSETHIAFIHMNQVKPAELKPLDDVKETIKTRLVNEKSVEMAQQLADEVKVKAQQDGLELNALKDEFDLNLVAARDVKRTGSNHPVNVVSAVFRLMAPDKTDDTIHVVQGNNNDVAVVQLLGVKSPDESSIAQLDQEAAQLERNIKTNETQLLLQALRQSADISINEELLNQQNQF